MAISSIPTSVITTPPSLGAKKDGYHTYYEIGVK
jgi:hypothetical protein